MTTDRTIDGHADKCLHLYTEVQLTTCCQTFWDNFGIPWDTLLIAQRRASIPCAAAGGVISSLGSNDSLGSHSILSSDTVSWEI